MPCYTPRPLVKDASCRCPRHVSCLVVVLAVVLLGSLRAQKIEAMAWGFDGVSVVAGRFNPLTLLVRNDGAAPVDEPLLLIESNGLRDVGAPFVERVYLAPGAQRVVQFVPYVSTDSTWQLRWAKSRVSARVNPQPTLSWPKTAALGAGSAIGQQGELPLFPASWFPATPGAAEALTDLVLDHDPEWDEPRARALLAWLRAGGRLHLLPRVGGALTLSPPLDVLNDPRRSFAFGAGLVQRVDVPLARLRLADLDRGPQPPETRTPPGEAHAGQILSRLQGSLLPQHPWGLIYLTAVLFLLCIGPGHWLLARRRIDWRLSLLYLLGVVGLFTLLFGYLGARGYDEVSAVRSIAHARVCGSEELAVTVWANAFVTAGGERTIRPQAEASLIATAQTQEAVDGVIDSGPAASLRVDMPMFSARGLVHRGHYRVARTPTVEARVDGGLSFHGAGALPVGGLLFRGGRLLALEPTGESGLNVGREVDHDWQEQHLLLAQQQVRGRVSASDQGFTVELARDLLLPIVRERLLMGRDLRLPYDTKVRAFVLCAVPPELLLAPDSGLGREQGYIVYEFDLDR